MTPLRWVGEWEWETVSSVSLGLSRQSLSVCGSSPFKKSQDISNMSSWPKVNDVKCNENEQALPSAFRSSTASSHRLSPSFEKQVLTSPLNGLRQHFRDTNIQFYSEIKFILPLTWWHRLLNVCSVHQKAQTACHWSAPQSMHQGVHWDEEINVIVFPWCFHHCQRALIQGWKAINRTYPKGIHTQYWCLKGCPGAKKGPCNSHGKGLPTQACLPSVWVRTLVSTLCTILKGHF